MKTGIKEVKVTCREFTEIFLRHKADRNFTNWFCSVICEEYGEGS